MRTACCVYLNQVCVRVGVLYKIGFKKRWISLYLSGLTERYVVTIRVCVFVLGDGIHIQTRKWKPVVTNYNFYC